MTPRRRASKCVSSEHAATPSVIAVGTPHDATAPGLDEARKKLQIDRMTPAERNAYYRHLDNVVILKDNIITATGEARLEARAEGRAEGIAFERLNIARKMRENGLDIDTIVQLTGIKKEDIL